LNASRCTPATLHAAHHPVKPQRTATPAKRRKPCAGRAFEEGLKDSNLAAASSASLLTGRLLRPDVDAAPDNIDAGVRVGAQVQIPRRWMWSAGVGGHHDGRVAVCEVLHRRGAGLPERRPVVCSSRTG
jgi:hypothetical protein